MNTVESPEPARIGPPIDEDALRRHVLGIVERQPTVGLAVGVVGPGGPPVFHGHGVADIGSRAPITESTVVRIASITKTMTAIAVMQLWERGRLELDAPADEYLRSFRLVPADDGFGPATVRDLLTHTAGLPEIAHPRGLIEPDFGESVEAGSRLPTLAEFYRGGLRVGARPGTRFVYNNHGPATLGQIVEDVSGQTLAGYLRANVFAPLGMVDSDLLRVDRLERRRATGYEIGRRGAREIAERDMVTAGAASVYSTPADMARYLQALVNGGSNEHGSVLEPETVAQMYRAHYRPDPRVPGMGLAFFRRNLGGHVVVGHQGSHPGFHSQVSLAPDAGLAVMAFTNGANQADLWLPGEVAHLLGRVLDLPVDDRPRVHRPEVWDDVCGWYRLSAGLTDVRLRAVIGAGAEVFIGKGRLRLRFLTPIPELAAGFALHPDDERDPYAYRIDLSDSGLDHMGIVFGQDPSGTTNRMHLDLMPLTLEKRPPASNPRRLLAAGLAAGGIAMVAGRRRR